MRHLGCFQFFFFVKDTVGLEFEVRWRGVGGHGVGEQRKEEPSSHIIHPILAPDFFHFLCG